MRAASPPDRVRGDLVRLVHCGALVDVSTRGELVARMFFDRCAPRLAPA
jgi:hypothetical protein